MDENKGVAVIENSITDRQLEVMKHNIEQFNKFKSMLITGKDKIKMGENEYIAKSGWVNLQFATNTSFEIIEIRKQESKDEKGLYYMWIVLGKATSPNGRYVTMWGACSSRDDFFAKKKDGLLRADSDIDEKDIITTAETNAFNRCMAFLWGMGELSYEEMRSVQYKQPNAPETTPPPTVEEGKEPVISEPQVRRLWAIRNGVKMSEDILHKYLKDVYKLDHTKNIPYSCYQQICEWVQNYKV